MFATKSRLQCAAFLTLFIHFTLVLADYDPDFDGPYDYYESSSWVAWPWISQFENFYNNNGDLLLGISTGVCNQTLSDYRTSYNAPRGSATANKLLAICYRHEACIYDQLGSNHALNYASALVLLGLLPTLVSTIGPGIAELSLLSAHRPLLSMALSLGAPATFPMRAFEFDDPNRVLSLEDNRTILRPFGRNWARLAITVMQYIFAVGAALNTIYNMVELGSLTILAWGCTTQFTPLMWAMISGIVNLTAAISYAFIKRRITLRQRREDETGQLQHRKGNSLTKFLVSELTLCANRENVWRLDSAEIPKTAILLNVAAGFMSFVQLVFGTAVFSSLQFITMTDVLWRIVLRLVGSAIACRLVLIMEMAGLRAVCHGGVDVTYADIKPPE